MNTKEITAIYKVEVAGERKYWGLRMLVEQGGALTSYLVAPDSESTSLFDKRDEARIARIDTLMRIQEDRPILLFQDAEWNDFDTVGFCMQTPRLRPLAKRKSDPDTPVRLFE